MQFITVYNKPWGVRGDNSYFRLEAPEESKEVEYDSWWEIRAKKESLRGYSWEGMKFETRIEAKQYLLKHKEEIGMITDAEITLCAKSL